MCSRRRSIRRAGNHPHTFESRIAEEANAAGKARGYADVGTVIGKKEQRVVWQKRRHPAPSSHLMLRVRVGATSPGASQLPMAVALDQVHLSTHEIDCQQIALELLVAIAT